MRRTDKKVRVEEKNSEEHLERVNQRDSYVHRLERKPRDPRVFARNLDRLTQMHGWTRKLVAQKIGAPYQWYRRLVTRGLSRIRESHRGILIRLTHLFLLEEIEDFWKPNLIEFKVRNPGLDAEADWNSQVVWRRKEFAPYAEKLAHILASGQHEYLKELIDNIHKLVPLHNLLKPKPGASYWSSGDDAD